MPDRKGTFYAPWPNIDGKPLNLQWGEIRSNQAELKALARNSFQELGAGDELNALRALLGQTYGDLVNNDRYRLLYDKTTQEFCVQRNDAFTDPPTWVDVWCIRPADGQFQVVSSGGILSTAGFYGPGLKMINLVADSQDAGTPTTDDISINCPDRILFDNCSGLKVRRIDCGAHKGAPEVTFTAPFGRSQVFNASGEEWVVPHNFGSGPQMVQVMDADDRVIIPDKIDVSDPNTAYFYFHATVVGSVIIATGGTGAAELRPKDPFYVVVRTDDKSAAGRTLRPNAELIFDSEFFYVNADERVADCRDNPRAFISLNSEIFYIDELKDVTAKHPITPGHVLMWEEQCSAFIPQEPKAGALYLNDLKDVEAATPAGGDQISYNVNTGFWESAAAIRSGFVHTQASASVEWIVNHGQSSSLLISQVFDESDRQIYPDVTDVSQLNIAYFYFTEAVSGKAFLIPTGPLSSITNVDHGLLLGLADDDHAQYARTDGTRDITGHQRFDDTINVENAVTAEAFYVTNTAELSEVGVLTPDGSASAVPHSFTSAPNSGMMLDGSADLKLMRAGDIKLTAHSDRVAITNGYLEVASNPIRANEGDAGGPGYTFDLDPDTGIFGITNQLGFSTGGVERARLAADGLNVVDKVKAEAFYVTSSSNQITDAQFLAEDGTLSDPSYAFTATPNTGMFIDGSGNLNLVRDGAVKLLIRSADTISSTNAIVVGNGNVTTPSFRSSGSSDTGIFFEGETFSITANGSRVANFGHDGMVVDGKVKAEAFYVAGSNLEFSTEAVTIPAVASTRDNAIYIGAEGMPYVFDPTRGKKLSVARQVFHFGKTDATVFQNEAMSNGPTLDPTAEVGHTMPRDGTITAVWGMVRQCDTDEMDMRWGKNDISPTTHANALVTLSFYVTAANASVHKIKQGLDIDVDRGDFIQAVAKDGIDSGGGGALAYPIFSLEIAWKDV